MRKLAPVWTAAGTALVVCYGVWAVTHIYTSITGYDAGRGKFAVLLLSPFIFMIAALAAAIVLNIAFEIIHNAAARTGIALMAFGIFVHGFYFVPVEKERQKQAAEARMLEQHRIEQEAKKQMESRKEAEAAERLEQLQQKYEAEKARLEEERNNVPHAAAGIAPPQLRVEKLSADDRIPKVTNISQLSLRIKINSVSTYMGPSDIMGRNSYRDNPERISDPAFALRPGESLKVFLNQKYAVGKLEFEIWDMDNRSYIFKSETAFYPTPPSHQ